MIRPCVICGRASVCAIPDGRVCQAHAIEYYTGLLIYAREQRFLARAIDLDVTPAPTLQHAA